MLKAIANKRIFDIKYLYLLVFGLGTQIISILLPPSRQISDSNNAFCNFYINKLHFFHVHLDCDAQYFLLDSQSPMRIINNQTPLQDRPLHTFLVFITSKALNIVGLPAGPINYLGEDGIPQTYNLLNYGVFIAFNAIILLASVVLVLKAMSSGGSFKGNHSKLIAATAFFLVVQNPVLREFFWTPHSKLFNILIPSLLFFLVQSEFVVTKRNYLVIMLLISTTLLMYPTFSIILPIFFLKTFRSLGIIRAIFIFSSLIPKLLWPLILNTFGGHYVDWPLTNHRRFIWIKDAYESNTLLEKTSDNLSAFLHSLPVTWTLILLILVVIGTYTLVTSISVASFKHKLDIQDSVMVLGIYSFGIVLNGEYGARFTTGITLLFGLIILKMAGKAEKIPRYWWIPFIAIISLNSWFWISN